MFKVLVEISARHVHLSPEHFSWLFSGNLGLKKIKDLSQKGEFAAKQTLTVKTFKNQFDKVRVIGPLREETQVEISLTDARFLGIDPPVRISGDLKGSEKCELVGPGGKINLNKGVIIAQRHLHLDPQTARQWGFEHGQFVSVRMETKDRSTTFHQVKVRVADNFVPAVHLDTDEANAAGIKQKAEGTAIKDNG